MTCRVNSDLRERSSNDVVRAVSDGQTDVGIVAGLVRTVAGDKQK